LERRANGVAAGGDANITARRGLDAGVLMQRLPILSTILSTQEIVAPIKMVG
jgi:hypothetical protein